MPDRPRLQPGSVPLEPGWYEELDADGAPTGVWVTVATGERLPTNPTGFSWRKAERAQQGNP